MIPLMEVRLGVHCREERRDAEFVCGSLEGLARGVRNALWTDLELFRDSDLILVFIGGDRPESRELAVEIESWQPGVPYETVHLPSSMLEELEQVRERNLPGAQYAVWDCLCEEYCDEPHGEGRIVLYVSRPSFHDLAMSHDDLSDQSHLAVAAVSDTGKAA